MKKVVSYLVYSAEVPEIFRSDNPKAVENFVKEQWEQNPQRTRDYLIDGIDKKGRHVQAWHYFDALQGALKGTKMVEPEPINILGSGYLPVVMALNQGRVIQVRPHGNSMTPLVRSGDKVTLTPLKAYGKPLEKGDIVFCKVNGRYLIHKVTALQGSRVQISNNHGLINGWTDKIFGVATEVER